MIIRNVTSNTPSALWLEVELTWPEVMLGCEVGVMRRVSAMRAGRVGRYGARNEDSWSYDINGALAELAVAKWSGVFWSETVGQVDLPDVGLLQVRSKLKSTDRLVIRPDDRDDQIFVSVRVETPRFRLCGWLWGYEGKEDRWLVSIDRPPMYFVPDEALHTMEELKRNR